MLNFWPTCEIFSMAIALTQMFQLKQNDIRYILQWSGNNNDPHLSLGNGVQMFVEANCTFANCYVTSNKDYFYGTDDFDAIIFDLRDLRNMVPEDFPLKRCWRQKYILTATDTADSLSICHENLPNNYFNWTWTYKLNSDLPRPYITVFNAEGEPIGPNIHIPWIEQQAPIPTSFIKRLNTKNKAAAWFVDECQTRSKREVMVKEISQELEQYSLSVDIFGHCGLEQCSEEEHRCLEMLRHHYYFYLAFENSLAPDFVTGSVVTAVETFAVPIVYGGADYTRFLPPGSYLDAKLLGPKRLAKYMAEIISNPNLFHDFFRWRNYYEIVRNDFTTDICGLCTIMNEQSLLVEETKYKNIRKWFNVNSTMCPKDRVLLVTETSVDSSDDPVTKEQETEDSSVEHLKYNLTKSEGTYPTEIARNDFFTSYTGEVEEKSY